MNENWIKFIIVNTLTNFFVVIEFRRSGLSRHNIHTMQTTNFFIFYLIEIYRSISIFRLFSSSHFHRLMLAFFIHLQLENNFSILSFMNAFRCIWNLNEFRKPNIFSMKTETMAVRVNEKCIGMCDKHRMTFRIFNETHVMNQQLAEMNVWLVNIEICSVFGVFRSRFDLVAFFWWFISISIFMNNSNNNKTDIQIEIEVMQRNMNEEDRMKMWCISCRNIIKMRNKTLFTEPKSHWYVTKQNDGNEREKKLEQKPRNNNETKINLLLSIFRFCWMDGPCNNRLLNF